MILSRIIEIELNRPSNANIELDVFDYEYN